MQKPSNAFKFCFFKIAINKDIPIYFLSGVTAEGRTNKDVFITCTDASVKKITLNGNEYISNDLITNEGHYTVVFFNNVGLSVAINFEIDKTPPTFELVGVSINGITNHNVSVSWNELNVNSSITTTSDFYDGIEYRKNQLISKEGSYIITLIDTVGNISSVPFKIDKTAPLFTLEGVSNNGRTNQNVALYWTEPGATATLNGAPYSSGTIVHDEGNHSILLSDALGNSTTVSFEIDKTPPTFELVGVEKGGRTKSNVILTWAEAYVKATLNDLPYTSGATIRGEGIYTIVLSDALSNSITVSFEIDKTPPTYELVGVEKGSYTNSSVSLKWTEATASALLNDFSYNNGDEIVDDGFYTIVLSDALGNSITVGFEINTQVPIFDTNLKSAKINYSVYFTWTTAGTSATLNDSEYKNKNWITKDGDYVFTITNKYGNSSTVSFSIKQLIDDVVISAPNLEEPLKIDPNKSYIIYTSFTVEPKGSGFLYINDIEMPFGTTITDIGVYNVKYIDDFGNIKEFKIEIGEKIVDHNISGYIYTGIAVAVVGLIVLLVIAALKKYKNYAKLSVRRKSKKKRRPETR